MGRKPGDATWNYTTNCRFRLFRCNFEDTLVIKRNSKISWRWMRERVHSFIVKFSLYLKQALHLCLVEPNGHLFTVATLFGPCGESLHCYPLTCRNRSPLENGGIKGHRNSSQLPKPHVNGHSDYWRTAYRTITAKGHHTWSGCHATLILICFCWLSLYSDK